MRREAFTLIELIVTMVIVGMLAAVAIPNFVGSINRSYAQDAMHNLMAIYAAQLGYAQNHNNAYCTGAGNCGNVTAINTALGLSIASVGGNTYDCAAVNGTCTATGNSFTMQVVLANPVSIGAVPVYCGAGANPCCQGGNAGAQCP